MGAVRRCSGAWSQWGRYRSGGRGANRASKLGGSLSVIVTRRTRSIGLCVGVADDLAMLLLLQVVAGEARRSLELQEKPLSHECGPATTTAAGKVPPPTYENGLQLAADGDDTTAAACPR